MKNLKEIELELELKIPENIPFLMVTLDPEEMYDYDQEKIIDKILTFWKKATLMIEDDSEIGYHWEKQNIILDFDNKNKNAIFTFKQQKIDDKLTKLWIAKAEYKN